MTGVLILIPAAGASSRMGGTDKLTLRVAGQAMLTRAAAIAEATGHRVLVTLREGDMARRTLLAGRRVGVAELADAGEGMSASLREAARQAQALQVAALMVLPADLPGLTPGDLAAVLAAWAEVPQQPIRGCAADGSPGHPVILPARLIPELLQLRGAEGARAVLARNPVRLLPLPGRRAVADIDTPEDYADWCAGDREPGQGQRDG